MTTIPGTVTWVTDSHFPGWVEIVFTQADGTAVAVEDKIPVFGIDVRPDIDCVVRSEVATVRLTYVDAEPRVATKTVRQ